VNGIYGLYDMSKSVTYDNTFFCDYVMSDFIRNLYASRPTMILIEFKIDLDNANLHNSRFRECYEQIRDVRVSHPADNPGLTPNNFFSFAYLRSKFQKPFMWTWAELNSYDKS
jgi:hypothetical protein